MSDFMLTLVGAIIGGAGSFLGAKMQIKAQDNKDRIARENERRESIKSANDIIKAFLSSELAHNAKEALKIEKELEKSYHEFIDSKRSITITMNFQFDEFDSSKLNLLKSDVQLVLRTITIYQSFKLLNLYNNKKLSELSENEYTFLKQSVPNWRKTYENSYKLSYSEEKLKEAVFNINP